MVEHRIVAYFVDEDAAEGVATQLHTMKARNIVVERMEKKRSDGFFPYIAGTIGVPQASSALNVGAYSSENIQFDTENHNLYNEKTSFIGSERQEEDRNVLLTFVVDGEDLEKALYMIQQERGKIQ